jgi:hypothetical protein
MILYNVTVNVENDVREEWVEWMKSVHIPDVLQTGYFSGHTFLKLLNEEAGGSGTTYAVQYHCPSLAHLQRYLEQEAPRLQREHIERYKGKFVAFRTFLETVE